MQLINAGQQLYQRSGASSDIGQLPESTKLQRQGPESFDALLGPFVGNVGAICDPPTRRPLSVKQGPIEACGIVADVLGGWTVPEERLADQFHQRRRNECSSGAR